MDIAIVGGTGAEGFGLTLRLAGAGHHVTIGSRATEKAQASAEEAKAILGADATVDGRLNAEAVVGTPVVFVTVPFAGPGDDLRARSRTRWPRGPSWSIARAPS